MKMKQRDNRIFALLLEKLHGKQFFEVPNNNYVAHYRESFKLYRTVTGVKCFNPAGKVRGAPVS